MKHNEMIEKLNAMRKEELIEGEMFCLRNPTIASEQEITELDADNAQRRNVLEEMSLDDLEKEFGDGRLLDHHEQCTKALLERYGQYLGTLNDSDIHIELHARTFTFDFAEESEQ